jgi:hypothetical protein
MGEASFRTFSRAYSASDGVWLVVARGATDPGVGEPEAELLKRSGSTTAADFRFASNIFLSEIV